MNDDQNYTKLVEVIPIEEGTVDALVNKERIAEIQKQVEEMNGNIASLVDWFTKLSKEQRGWIQIENKDVFYQTEACVLYPNFATFVCGVGNTYYSYNPGKFKNLFEGYTGRLPTKDEILLLCSVENYPFLQEKFKFSLNVNEGFTVHNQTKDREDVIKRNGSKHNHWNGGAYTSYHLPVHPLPKQSTLAGCLLQLMDENLIPMGMPKNQKETFLALQSWWDKHKNFLKADANGIYFLPQMAVFLQNQTEVTTLTGKTFDFATMKQEYTAVLPISNPEAELDLRVDIDKNLLYCDNIRANLEPYQEKILTDPNGGHWDLWGQREVQKDELSLKLQNPLVARNPEADVRADGIIGIDFGTKSTVVVFQEDSEQTLPLRVGTGDLSKEIDNSHYENPTVLEFVDLTSFLSAYKAKSGRPETTWEQVTTSHTAFDNFLQSSSDQYYAYLYELKQWAGDKQRKIHLRDKQNVDMVLDPYQQLSEGDFDPIEIYAYYLGLYINNMHNGIYLDYLLSYPVAYEKSVRDRIVASFTRGLKKSLPESILNNASLMETFRVELGASEPVAYAICALEECGFEPQGDEEIFYGVFDFGGGTTDFDFGLYRESKSRRYDYEMQSFGDSGDQYLGGENLLELLAFHVFKSNQALLRQENITFERPSESKRFAGDETLISDSQEAKLNMAQLKEQLRPLWERHEGYEEAFESGTIKASLFNSKGDSLTNIALEVSKEALEEVLRARIEQGVRNFFESLVLAFNLPKNTAKVETVYILKAGNSSKSAILTEVMEKYIEIYNKIINKGEGANHFLVFPPLGTEEADEFMREQGLKVKARSVEEPTCKTGVAFGLISSRQGGKIKLIREKATTEEVKFPFFLGYETKKKFSALQKNSMDYGKWVEFIDAEEEDFSIYYSKLPIVLQGETSIEDVKRKRCRLKQTEMDANVYVRPATPTTIEYVVASPQGIKKEKYLSDIVTEVLED